jgi:hypothetical protein
VRSPVAAIAALVLAAVLLRTSSVWSAAQAPALPARDPFMAMVRSAIRLDQDLQKDFAYIERRRDARVSALGKVVVGPLRTFETAPVTEPGRTYKRLIAIDGKPLDPLELQKRDAEHLADLDEEARKRSRETPAQRAKRLERAAREQREDLAILADALAVFDPSIVAREQIGGEATIVVRLTPRPNARTTTREGGWMKQFQGRGWFVEADGQLARLEMHAFDDVSIGWGIVGRLHKGSGIVVERRRVGQLWLPARLTFEGTGRTLMLRPFDVTLLREYSDYKSK